MNHATNRRWLGRLILVVVPFALGCGACSERSDQVPPAEIQNIRHLSTGLPLPQSASNVWHFENKFQDAIQLLRFDASLADARRFARAVLRGNPVRGQPPIGRMAADYDWWIRAYPPGGEGGEFQDYPYGEVVLILQPTGDRARIWVLTGDNCDRPQACTWWLPGNRDRRD